MKTTEKLDKPTSEFFFRRAVDTLASMCVAYKTGNGPDESTFIQTLRLYADEMEKELFWKGIEKNGQ